MSSLSKLKTLSALERIVQKLKSENKTIVFTNGCFDLLHPGHIKLLEQAKRAGDVLIVALNSDASVKKLKDARRPILNQNARVRIIAAIKWVDYIIIFKELTPLKLIQKIRPHILAKGGDWAAGKIVGRNFAKRVMRIKLEKNYTD